jgi:hypothetical protein
MGALAIDINDAGLVVADESGVRAVEPGFASLERGKIVTGEAARARARRQPRQTSNRFWSALSTDANSAGADLGLTAAELAHAQLQALWARVASGIDDVLLVVPGGYRSDQLGLLLGLAQECGMPVRAFVDAAVAASVRPFPGRQLMYVDASLYRTAVTLVEQNGDAQARVEHSLNQGLAGLADVFARRIADLFVRATRFDPFAHADTEQAVYDNLPAWLAALQREEQLEVALEHRDEEFRVTAERAAVLGVAEGYYRAVRQLIAQHREPGKALVVQLSDRLAALPGFVGELARLDDTSVECFDLGHAARGALLVGAPSAAPAGQVKLLKRLAWRAEAKLAAAAAQPLPAAPALGNAQPPTHLVHGGLAYRVGADGLLIGREAEPGRRTVLVGAGSSGVSRVHCEVVLRDGELKLRDLSTFGTFVNERKVAGETTLKRADVIRVGSPGAELHVVSLEGER